MRTNGLSNKQLMQGLIFDFSLKAFLFCILFFAGCRSWKWTDFEFINLCNVKLHIVVSGVYPDISHGNMPPDSNGFETCRDETGSIIAQIIYENHDRIVLFALYPDSGVTFRRSTPQQKF
jgi:hypothetical protein